MIINWIPHGKKQPESLHAQKYLNYSKYLRETRIAEYYRKLRSPLRVAIKKVASQPSKSTACFSCKKEIKLRLKKNNWKPGVFSIYVVCLHKNQDGIVTADVEWINTFSLSDYKDG